MIKSATSLVRRHNPQRVWSGAQDQILYSYKWTTFCCSSCWNLSSCSWSKDFFLTSASCSSFSFCSSRAAETWKGRNAAVEGSQQSWSHWCYCRSKWEMPGNGYRNRETYQLSSVDCVPLPSLPIDVWELPIFSVALGAEPHAECPPQVVLLLALWRGGRGRHLDISHTLHKQ